jgi:hypothetical protein
LNLFKIKQFYNVVNLLSRKVLFIIGIVALIGVAIFYLILKTRGPVCGNGICEYGETQDNCCKDCSCYNQVCNLELNRCEFAESKLTDEEVNSTLTYYLESKGLENNLLNITDIANTVFQNKVGKGATIFLKDRHFLNGIVLDNGTVFIMEETRILDVWQKI